MTNNRCNPWGARMAGTGFVESEDVDIMASVADSWPDMARIHCEGRNSVVAGILVWAVVIRHLHPVSSARFSAAEFQLPRNIETTYKVPAAWAKRMDEYKLGAQEREEFSEKCTTTQDAHRAPCAILFNGVSLESFLPAESKRHHAAFYKGALGGHFGAVDRLPTIFNESDSHVEKVGFKGAFLSACLAIPNDRSGGLSAGLFEERLRKAYAHWNSRATKACDIAIERNQERLKVAEKKKDGAERIYREAKIEVIGHYRTHTGNNIPEIFEPGGVYMAYEVVSELL